MTFCSVIRNVPVAQLEREIKLGKEVAEIAEIVLADRCGNKSSGSVFNLFPDPDPAIFVIDLQDASN
jgi:hypothetical protein